jgi:hypothetical protein
MLDDVVNRGESSLIAAFICSALESPGDGSGSFCRSFTEMVYEPVAANQSLPVE